MKHAFETIFPHIPAALLKQFGVGVYFYSHPTKLCLLNAKPCVVVFLAW